MALDTLCQLCILVWWCEVSKFFSFYRDQQIIKFYWQFIQYIILVVSRTIYCWRLHSYFSAMVTPQKTSGSLKLVRSLQSRQILDESMVLMHLQTRWIRQWFNAFKGTGSTNRGTCWNLLKLKINMKKTPFRPCINYTCLLKPSIKVFTSEPQSYFVDTLYV